MRPSVLSGIVVAFTAIALSQSALAQPIPLGATCNLPSTVAAWSAEISPECWWFWELEYDDTCTDWQEASVDCKVEYMMEGMGCDSCMSTEHFDAIGFDPRYPESKYFWPPDTPVWKRIERCFKSEVERCDSEELGSVFYRCVVRVTGIRS
jgi:hypothetical protein